MKKNIIKLSAVAMILASCSPQYGPSSDSRGGPSISKQDVGTVAGALGGAFLGSNVGKGKGRTLGIAAGTLLGGYIGSEIGASLDRADRNYYSRTLQNSFETTTTGTTSKWINPDSGNSGTVTPTRTFKTNSGQFCREFTQSIVISNEREEAFGTACRQADGSWKIVN